MYIYTVFILYMYICICIYKYMYIYIYIYMLTGWNLEITCTLFSPGRGGGGKTQKL